MSTKTKSPSKLLETVHETARDLHAAGFIDMRSMKNYDALCLAPLPAYSSSKERAPQPLASHCPKC
jgi:putative transcriptional regulator